MKKFLFLFGKFLSSIIPYGFVIKIKAVLTQIYSGYHSRGFASYGNTSIIRMHSRQIVGKKMIKVGDNTFFGQGLLLSAWNLNEDRDKGLKIIIGSGCSIGDNAHITAVNKIIIGDGVLTGRNILITDNSHGSFEKEQLIIPPDKRSIVSKGAVVVEKNVWIGNNVSIVGGGITIGESSIIAANAVVTKNVPPFSLVAGVPAEVIKKIE